MAYDVGDLIRISASFVVSSSAADPTSLQLSVYGPGGSVRHIYGTSASLIKDSTGIYHLDYSAASSGPYSYMWAASGNAEGAQQGFFSVDRQGF